MHCVYIGKRKTKLQGKKLNWNEREQFGFTTLQLRKLFSTPVTASTATAAVRQRTNSQCGKK